MNELQQLYADWDRIWDEWDKKRVAVVRKVLPIGQRVSWMHGLNKQNGDVVGYGYADRVEVKNRRTGVKRWIDARYVTPECGGEADRGTR